MALGKGYRCGTNFLGVVKMDLKLGWRRRECDKENPAATTKHRRHTLEYVTVVENIKHISSVTGCDSFPFGDASWLQEIFVSPVEVWEKG